MRRPARFASVRLQPPSNCQTQTLAYVSRIRLGDVGESQQQSLPAVMRHRAARQGLHRKSRGLCELRQFNIVKAAAKSGEQVLPPGLNSRVMRSPSTRDRLSASVRRRAP